MALRTTTPLPPAKPIDSRNDEAFQSFGSTTRPDLDGINVQAITMTYDALSDTFLLHLFGRDVPSVAIYGGGYWYWLVNPDTEACVGVQIEEFVEQAIQDHPDVIDALKFAELRGLTIAEINERRHQVLGYRGRVVAWSRQEIRRLRRDDDDEKMALVERLLRHAESASVHS